jgi:hypothetical protein
MFVCIVAWHSPVLGRCDSAWGRHAVLVRINFLRNKFEGVNALARVHPTLMPARYRQSSRFRMPYVKAKLQVKSRTSGRLSALTYLNLSDNKFAVAYTPCWCSLRYAVAPPGTLQVSLQQPLEGSRVWLTSTSCGFRSACTRQSGSGPIPLACLCETASDIQLTGTIAYSLMRCGTLIKLLRDAFPHILA